MSFWLNSKFYMNSNLVLRKIHSANLTLIDIVERIRDALDKGEKVMGI